MRKKKKMIVYRWNKQIQIAKRMKSQFLKSAPNLYHLVMSMNSSGRMGLSKLKKYSRKYQINGGLSASQQRIAAIVWISESISLN